MENLNMIDRNESIIGTIFRAILYSIVSFYCLQNWSNSLLEWISNFLTWCLTETKRRAVQNSIEKPESCELTQCHIDMIASRRWKELLAWIVFHPDQLRWVDKKNQTALHHACLFRAPAQIIEMMLYQEPELAAMKNKDNELPLHWAVRLSAPNEVIRWLLTANPASACIDKDNQNDTALSLVWDRHEEAITDLWWRSDRDEIARHPGWKRILFFLQCYSYSLWREQQRTVSANVENGDDPQHFDELEKHSSHFLPLHTVSRCPCCPLTLFTFILKMHKDDLRTTDKYGRLPLAVACLDAVSNRSTGALSKVGMLLTEYSDAAKVVDIYGRSPLFTALASGLIWEEGIDRLIALDPKSLLLRDTLTDLPPFLLAATGAEKLSRAFEEKNPNKNGSYQGESRSLSTIYSLLREDPAQISNIKLSNSFTNYL